MSALLMGDYVRFRVLMLLGGLHGPVWVCLWKRHQGTVQKCNRKWLAKSLAGWLRASKLKTFFFFGLVGC